MDAPNSPLPVHELLKLAATANVQSQDIVRDMEQHLRSMAEQVGQCRTRGLRQNQAQLTRRNRRYYHNPIT